MSWQTHPPHPIEALREGDHSFYMDALNTLVRVGVGLATTLEYRGVDTTFDGSDAVLDAASAFEKVARAIRRTIMLASKLAKTDPNEPDPAPRQPPSPPTKSYPAITPRPEYLDRDRPEPVDDLTEPPSPQDRPDSEHSPGDSPDDALDHLPIPAQIAAIRDDLARAGGMPETPPLRTIRIPDPGWTAAYAAADQARQPPEPKPRKPES